MLDLIFEFIKTFNYYIMMILPFFILGAVFSAVIQSFFKKSTLSKYINKGFGSVINASFLGAVLPGCACVTMPIVEGMKKKINNIGAATSFVMASPLLSPQTIILTYGLLGMKFTVGRIFFSLVGSIFFGFICQTFQKRKIRGFEFESVENTHCHNHNHNHNHEDHHQKCNHKTKEEDSVFYVFSKIIKRLWKFFLIGLFIATLLTVLIPKEVIPQYIGSSGFLAFFLALIIGIPLYVHEGEEIPIILSFTALGLGQGPSMTFLLGSVGTCIPTLIMAKQVIGRLPTILYAIYWIVFAFGSGLIFQLV